jgi:hypothetical protein
MTWTPPSTTPHPPPLLHTGKLECLTELSSRETALLRRKLSALLSAGGSDLAALDAELNDVLGSGQADDQLMLRLQDLQQQQQLGKGSKGGSSLANSLVTAAVPWQATKAAVPAGSQGSNQGPLTPEGLLASALEDAESTIALLQAQLVTASSEAAGAGARVRDLEQRLTAAAVRRTREVASARAAGEVQLATLQDAVRTLGQRDDMAGQVGSCCDCCAMPRT